MIHLPTTAKSKHSVYTESLVSLKILVFRLFSYVFGTNTHVFIKFLQVSINFSLEFIEFLMFFMDFHMFSLGFLMFLLTIHMFSLGIMVLEQNVPSTTHEHLCFPQVFLCFWYQCICFP